MKGSHTYLHSLLYIKAMLRCHAAVSFHIHPCPWNTYAKVQRHVRKEARGRIKHATHRKKESITQGKGGCRISKPQRPPIYKEKGDALYYRAADNTTPRLGPERNLAPHAKNSIWTKEQRIHTFHHRKKREFP